MFELLSRFRSVNELRDFAKSNTISLTPNELRGEVRIAVIDDEKFEAHHNLQSYGYNISILPDIQNISSIFEYDVILCDLMGVGQHFDKNIGGASIIREIKSNYPTKFVIAYSGARANSSEMREALKFSDSFLKKDADLTTWVNELDGFIDVIIDPYEMWLITRDQLIRSEIDLKSLIKLEDAYVRSVVGRDKNFTALKSISARLDIPGNTKGIVQSLVASAIFKIALGL